MGYMLSKIYQPKIVAPLDTYSFLLDGVAYPRAYKIRTLTNEGVFLNSAIFERDGEQIFIPLTSSVTGVVYNTVAALATALSVVVTPT